MLIHRAIPARAVRRAGTAIGRYREAEQLEAGTASCYRPRRSGVLAAPGGLYHCTGRWSPRGGPGRASRTRLPARVPGRGRVTWPRRLRGDSIRPTRTRRAWVESPPAGAMTVAAAAGIACPCSAAGSRSARALAPSLVAGRRRRRRSAPLVGCWQLRAPDGAAWQDASGSAARLSRAGAGPRRPGGAGSTGQTGG